VPDVALTAIAGMAQNYALGKYVHELKEQCLSDEQAVESFTRIAMDGLRGFTPRSRSLPKKK